MVAVQLDPDHGNVDTYWLAHGTVLIRAGKHHVKRMVDADGRLSSPVDAMRQVRQRRVVRMIGLHKTNKRSIDELDEDDAEFDLDRKHRRGNPPHQLQLHGPAQQESPEPVANDAATEPDVEVLDSPADADEFHDAIEQMDRQIDQLERPPDSPFSYAPTTPAETVIGENDEPNTNDNANANTTATLPADMPADADLPPVPTDDESDGHDDPSKAVNTLPGQFHPRQLILCLPALVVHQQQITLCLLTLVMTDSGNDAEGWIKAKWLGLETIRANEGLMKEHKMTLKRNAKRSKTALKLVSTV